MTDLTPAAHARLSPSGSKRWFACPGSLTLADEFPDEPNSYSDEGTAMHDVAAHCLTTGLPAGARIGEWIVVSRPGEEVRKVCLSEDMADLVQDYVDMVRSVSRGHVLNVEHRVEFSKFVGMDNQFGTADFDFFDRARGELVVGDLKTGHKPVYVEDNSQALTYALGALGEMYERAMRAAAQPEDDDDLA